MKISKKYLRLSFLILLSLFFFSCQLTKKITSEDLLHDREVNSYINFETFIWHRGKGEKIKFNNKNLSIIIKKYKTGNHEYFSSLQQYQFYMAFFYDEKKENSMPFDERAYLVGYLTDFLYRNKDKSKKSLYKNFNFINRLLSLKNNYNNRYNFEFKKHDYYDLKFLKKHHLNEYEKHTIDTIQKPSNKLSD